MKDKANVIILVTVFIAIANTLYAGGRQPAAAAGPEIADVISLVADGQAQAALDLVAQTAAELGGWGPAPGDSVAFDPYLSRQVRGSVLDYDELPDCSDPAISPDKDLCIADFLRLEASVRFGPSLFSTPEADGSATPRPAFDDLLSTFIEEVGHSWQEYLYETDGQGGARQRSTSRTESERWSAGREYQIKRYILSLDGSVLSLSDQQRGNLQAQICTGYANPLGHDVPVYGAPAGWPNPAGWPTAAPTPAELQAFCTGS